MFIGAPEIQQISPYTVHKEFEEDVLVCNERVPIPASFDEKLLDNPELDDIDRAELRRFYRPGAAAASSLQSGRLYLRSLPTCLDKSWMCGRAAVDSSLLARYYTDTGSALVLHADAVDEIDEVQLMQAFVERPDHLKDKDRVAISNIFDRLPSFSRPRSMYVNLVIDTTNSIYFRRHQEHVPGIMLIEAARQAMYAHYHHFSHWTRSQAAFTIESLHVDFHNFINPNYPVRIRVEEVRSAAESRSSGEKAASIASFYQSNKLAAVATLRANVIKTELFKRMRNVKPLASCNRFLPVKNIAKTAAFVSAGGKRLEGTLNDISAGGINASFDHDPSLELNAQFDFLMFVDTIGLIGAKVELLWKEVREGRNVAGFKIIEIQTLCEKRLRETIKNFTFLNMRREVV
ncbi:MAG: PilZ domain-containing protein [Burkholderiales bacterium]|jgi:hypothetical protein|nr:PilZ domain-containing protein [Burkholderiales bacterium]